MFTWMNQRGYQIQNETNLPSRTTSAHSTVTAENARESVILLF